MSENKNLTKYLNVGRWVERPVAQFGRVSLLKRNILNTPECLTRTSEIFVFHLQFNHNKGSWWNNLSSSAVKSPELTN